MKNVSVLLLYVMLLKLFCVRLKKGVYCPEGKRLTKIQLKQGWTDGCESLINTVDFFATKLWNFIIVH